MANNIKQFEKLKHNDLDSRIPLHRPDTWEKLMEYLYGETWQPDIRCYRSNLIYRGLPNFKFRLLSKLQRIAGETTDGPGHVRVIEKPIIRNFQRYCANIIKEESDSLWRWLSIMEYHGAPTRMLDWSQSPLVALHFAVDDEEHIDNDGIVWCINPNELATVDVPEDFVAGEGVRYQLYTGDQLDQKINRATKRKNADMGLRDPHFIPNTKREITTVLDELDGFCSGDHPFVIFLDPPSDKRIINQATIYSITASPVAVFDDWLERSPHCCFKVIISAKLKKEIRDKLSQANITERVLFPGLEGLGKWLKKYYTPRNPSPTTDLKLSLDYTPKSIKSYTPTSWENLLDILFCDDLMWDSNLGMHRSKYVFRGLPSKAFSLASSLQTMSKGDMKHAKIVEEHIIRNFKRYAYGSFSEMGDNLFNWLSLAQHHGTPTRLLDWTQSPMVALFFATNYMRWDNEDGVIVCINPTYCSKFVPKDIIGNTDNKIYNVYTADQLEMKIKGSDHFMLSALKEVNLQLASTRSLNIRDLELVDPKPFLVFLEPPSLDERIVHQFGLFSMLSQPDVLLDTWIEEHPECCRRIIIPAKMKSEIRDKLDHSNINERVLFPGLNGTSQFLARYYNYRPRI